MKRFLTFYSIYKRRNSTRHLSGSLLKRIIKLICLLVVLVIVNTCAMVYFEGMKAGDALWLSSTTITTVGYGDFSPATLPGRLITVITMYMFAITVLSLLIAETVDWRVFISEKKRKGLWEWKNMSDHIQIINTPNHDTERYLVRLLKQMKITPELADLPIQILTRKFKDGLPEKITRMKVIHRSGAAEDGDIIRSLNLDKAKYVVILAQDATDAKSDSLSFDILCRVREISSSACVVVEAVSDTNKERFLKFGANVVMRPVRAYPEMIVRFMAHPGTEKVLENLFEYSDDSLSRIETPFKDMMWKDIVIQSVSEGHGTPLAYINQSGVTTNPSPNAICSGTAIIAMVNQEQTTNTTALSFS